MRSITIATVLLSLGFVQFTDRAHATPAQTQAGAKIPTEVIGAAVERANARMQRDVKIHFDPWNAPADSVLVTQAEGSQPLADTMVLTIEGQQVTNAFILYPEAIFSRFKGAQENPGYLEDLLYMILCHEYDHMPESPGGGVPAHPTDPGGSDSVANRCATIRHYQADGERACQEATAAASNPTLSPTEACRAASGFCRFYKHIQELANTPENLAVAASCNPPVLTSGGEIVGGCFCDSLMGDCPTHGF